MAARCPRLPAVLAAGTVIVFVIAGCGGSTKNAATATRDGVPDTSVLTEWIRLREGALPGGGYVRALTVHPGDVVDLATSIPSRGTSYPSIAMTIDRGPAGSLSVTATGSGQNSTATLKSADGNPISLLFPRYGCFVPPHSTFCPPTQALTEPSSYRLQFLGASRTPIIVVADVGPPQSGTVIPPPAQTSSAKVPPYKISLMVRDTTAAQSNPKVPYKTSLTAHDGDVISIHAVPHGKAGAPQNIRLSFAKGPTRQITVTASVPGGKPAHAVINAAPGAQLTLDRPRYVCAVPPTVSFCPLREASLSSAGYSLTFPTSPQAPVLVAVTNGRTI